MIIQHREGEKRGKFFIREEEETVAQIVYAKSGDRLLIIEHTEVKEDLQGRNIGYELVQKTVDHARQQGRKISPLCPFAKALFDKRPDWQDLLDEGY